MQSNQYRRPLAIVTSLYFFFGFITCLNDVLVPHLKGIFTLNYTQAILIQFAFFSSYFLVSIPSSKFCEKVGYQKGMSLGLVITAFGAAGFLASAQYASYMLFLLSFLVLAAGITLIQVAVNPYVSLLGPPEQASSRMSWTGAFNSLGTMIAPLLGSYFILSNASVDSVKMPYAVITGALLLLAIMIYSVKLPTVSNPQKDNVTWTELFKNKRFMMGVWGIFAYVGAEVAIGSFLVNWLGDSHVTSLSPEVAGRYIAIYWGGAMVGRFIGTPILSRREPLYVLQWFVLGAMGLTALSVFASGSISQWSILSVGLFNSIMFPTIFSESVVELKKGSEKASGLLCAAIVGGAVVPLIQGIIADYATLRWSFLVPVAFYGYLFYFAAKYQTTSKSQWFGLLGLAPAKSRR